MFQGVACLFVGILFGGWLRVEGAAVDRPLMAQRFMGRDGLNSWLFVLLSIGSPKA